MNRRQLLKMSMFSALVPLSNSLKALNLNTKNDLLTLCNESKELWCSIESCSPYQYIKKQQNQYSNLRACARQQFIDNNILEIHGYRISKLEVAVLSVLLD